MNTENLVSDVRYRIDLLMANVPAENKVELPSDGKIRDAW